MKLNIHIISHPLIQSLSNITKNSVLQSRNTNQATRQLGLFIIYETIRKWIKVYKLTIQQIKKKKDIIIVDPKESYTLIFNDIHLLSMFQEVQLLLPKVHLQLVKENSLNQKNIILFNEIDNFKDKKIIIIDYEINLIYIESILSYLLLNKKITLNQIYIACITCATDQLIGISEKYNDLNVYTTKIIKT